MVGLDHKAAPVETREQFFFDKTEIVHALHRLLKRRHVREAVLLTTCNRTECYIVAHDRQCIEQTKRWLVKERGLPSDACRFLLDISYPKSVHHLFRVASGLESMVKGESQVFTQVREAYILARDGGSAKRFLSRCFEAAISAARRVRLETPLAELDVSVPAVVAKLACKHIGSLRNKTLLVLGASEMAELTLVLLQKAGIQRILVANRSLTRARCLSERFKAEAFELTNLPRALSLADMAVCCTASTTPVLTPDLVSKCMQQRPDRPLFLVDIAVPRDVEPSVGLFERVELYNIDDLEGIASATIQENEGVLVECDRIIQEEVQRFLAWRDSLQAGPVIHALRHRAERVMEEEMQRLFRRQRDMTEEQKQAFVRASHRILGRLLHDPMIQIRNMAGKEEGEEKLEALRNLLGLE